MNPERYYVISLEEGRGEISPVFVVGE